MGILRIIAPIVLFALSSGSAHAMFIERYIARWRQARTERFDAMVARLPLFERKFLSLPANSARAREGVFRQRLDHFDPRATREFNQRYWVNSAYASGPDAPVFYSICGESRCGPPGGFAVQLAKEYRAHLVTLEHRYYGDSVPTPTYDPSDLRFLETRQALADLAAFQSAIAAEAGLQGKWIAIGGSYPGSLSAYYRAMYPAKVAAALASSAPVEARADFFEYDQQVARAVPPECLAAMQRATRAVEADLRDPVRADAVKRLFGAGEVRDDVDFLYVVADMGAIAVQYGAKAEFCRALTAAEDPKIAYAGIGRDLFEKFGITPLEDTAQGNSSVDPDVYRNGGMRQWLYQSCTEYGYWQVANPDPRESARSARIDRAFHDGICTRLFGIRRPVDTAATNRRYYDAVRKSRVGGILFTNGEDDPWQHLSITPRRRNLPARTQAVLIRGAAHCTDLGNSRAPAVEAARKRFRTLIQRATRSAEAPKEDVHALRR